MNKHDETASSQLIGNYGGSHHSNSCSSSCSTSSTSENSAPWRRIQKPRRGQRSLLIDNLPHLLASASFTFKSHKNVQSLKSSGNRPPGMVISKERNITNAPHEQVNERKTTHGNFSTTFLKSIELPQPSLSDILLMELNRWPHYEQHILPRTRNQYRTPFPEALIDKIDNLLHKASSMGFFSLDKYIPSERIRCIEAKEESVLCNVSEKFLYCESNSVSVGLSELPLHRGKRCHRFSWNRKHAINTESPRIPTEISFIRKIKAVRENKVKGDSCLHYEGDLKLSPMPDPPISETRVANIFDEALLRQLVAEIYHLTLIESRCRDRRRRRQRMRSQSC